MMEVGFIFLKEGLFSFSSEREVGPNYLLSQEDFIKMITAIAGEKFYLVKNIHPTNHRYVIFQTNN